MLNTGDGDLKVIPSFDWPRANFTCREEESEMERVDGVEEGEGELEGEGV